jgi:hypothetical protein
VANNLWNKYLSNQTIGKADKKLGDSHFWSGLMKVKSNFLRFESFQLNNGSQIRFWEDKWIGNHVFKDQYQSLYNIVRRNSDTVEKVLSEVPINVSFRRQLTGNNLILWYYLVQRLNMFLWTPTMMCFIGTYINMENSTYTQCILLWLQTGRLLGIP